MSASREKKQRQGTVSQALTQAELREQKEAAAKRRNGIIYTVIGVVVALAVVALLVWDSGLMQKNAVAATVGDTKLSVAEMQCYYGMVRQSDLYNQYMYAMAGYAYPSAPLRAYDRTDALGEQQIYNTETNQTYRQHWEETALEFAQQIIAVSSAAKQNSFTLSEEGQKDVDDTIAALATDAASANYPNAASYIKANFGRYVTEDIYKSIYTTQKLATEYQTHCQKSLSFDQADYDAYAQEHPQDVNSYDYRYAFISGAPEAKLDADGKAVEATDEEKAAALAAAKEKADALVAGVQAAQPEEDKEPADEGEDKSEDKEPADEGNDKSEDKGEDKGESKDEGDGKDDAETQEPLSPEELLLKAKEDAFNKLVVDAVGETSAYANPNSNLQTAVLGYDLSPSYYNSVFYEWITSSDRAPGDITAIEGTSTTPGYHVVFYVDRYLDNDNTMNFRHILIQPEALKDDPETPDVDESKGREDDPDTEIDESTIPTDEQLAAAKAKAEDILAQYEAGEKTEEAFAALANENSSDPGSNTAGGLYTYVTKGYMVPGVDEWIFDPARQSGDTAIVSNVEPGSDYYGYHVMYFSAVNDPRWPTVADSALKAEANNAWLEELLVPYPAAWTDSSSLIH